MGGFPSGQRGQTVNLLALPSKVRILLRPLIRQAEMLVFFLLYYKQITNMLKLYFKTCK